MRVRENRIREVLDLSPNAWSKLKATLRTLNNAELERAEELERLGRRRLNVLHAMRSERYCRRFNPQEAAMLRLKSEANL